MTLYQLITLLIAIIGGVIAVTVYFHVQIGNIKDKFGEYVKKTDLELYITRVESGIKEDITKIEGGIKEMTKRLDDFFMLIFKNKE